MTLLNFEELEKRSDVSRYTWAAWVRARKLPCVRLGRRVLVEEADFQRFIEANRIEARRHRPA